LYLKARKLRGLRFRKQHPIGPYILDFFCAEAALAVEIDGSIHGARRP
jgi:very-short-patch-repair endonuclease